VLREFWFGWRVAKLFPTPERLDDYCRGLGPQLDVAALGPQQQIRYWVLGTLDPQADPPTTRLVLYDADSGSEHTRSLEVDYDGRLAGMRRVFVNWLAGLGLGFPTGQAEKAFWAEPVTPAALDALGRAQEEFYTFSAYGSGGSLDLDAFERAVTAAPDSYMAHDLLGWAQYRNQRYGPAEASFRRALELNPHGAGVAAGLAWCALHSGDRAGTLEWALYKAECMGTDPAQAKAWAERMIAKHAQ
jgi:hypothetical protein